MRECGEDDGAKCQAHIWHLIFAGWSTENLVVEWGVLWHPIGVADGKLSPAWGAGLR